MSFSIQLPTYQVETKSGATLYPSHTEANNHYQQLVDKIMFPVNCMRMDRLQKEYKPT